MVNRQDQAMEKGINVARTIEALLILDYGEWMAFEVRTEQNCLTKVLIRCKVREPDAAGQGGSAPPG